MIPNKDWQRARLCRKAKALLRKVKHGHVIDHRGAVITRKAASAVQAKFTGLLLPKVYSIEGSIEGNTDDKNRSKQWSEI